MKKDFTTGLSAVLLLTFCLLTGTPLALAQEVKKAPNASEVEVPLCLKHGIKISPTSVSSQENRSASLATMKKAVAGKMLWGDVAQSQNWEQNAPQYGMYGFQPTDPVTMTRMTTSEQPIARNGSAQIDGVFYSVDADFSDYEAYGIVSVYWRGHDVQTWQETEMQLYMDKNTMVALETAQAQDGTVYGLFYNDAMNGFEWATADFKTMTRKTIGAAKQAYVALGVTGDKKLYGVAADGNLYAINTATGVETLVGATGVELKIPNTSGSTYGQSGEIAPKDNTFYWTAVSGNGAMGLYTVNLQNGKATKIADMGEQVHALTVPAPLAHDAAPAQVSGLDVILEQGATNGIVKFTAPTLTYGGETLSGDKLTYKVWVNGNVVTTGDNALPGQETAVPVNGLPEGMVKFAVSTGNNVGFGPKAGLEKWVGMDTPEPPVNVTLNVTQSGVATVKWQAPATGVHGGFVGENLKYNVYRVAGKSTKQVASEITDLTFSETLAATEEYKSYSYQVVAVNAKGKSKWANSNAIGLGKALDVPYFEPFRNKNSMEKFTVIDVNNDGRYWSWAKDFEAVRCNWNVDDKANDWLITPPLHFKKGQSYKISYLVRGAKSSFTERIEVKYGNQPTVEAMKTSLLVPTEIKNDKYVEYSHVVKLDRDYDLFLGFHAMSEPAQFLLYVDSITVDVVPEPKAPGAVTDVLLTPDVQGNAKINVAFKAPKVAVDGSELSAIDRIELRRDNAIIHTFASPSPGQKFSFLDDKALMGNNAYSIIAYNEHDAGEKVAVWGYAGYDKPIKPQWLKAIDNQSSVTLSWSPSGYVGVNGGVVGDKLGYVIYEIGKSGQLENKLDSVTTTDYSIDLVTESGKQNVKYWAVVASNQVGQSDVAIVPLVTGKALQLPYEESFNEGVAQNFIWQNSLNSMLTTSESVDAGDGCVIFKGETQSAMLGLPKIALEKAERPMFTFAHKSTQGAKASLRVQAVCPDGTKEVLKEFDYAQLDHAGEWMRERIDLTPFASQRYVAIQFVYSGKSDEDKVCVDGLAIFNALSHDLVVSMTAPEEVTKGSKLHVGLAVDNRGVEKATNYTVTLEVDGKQYCTFEGTPLESFGNAARYEADIPVSVFGTENEMTIDAEINYTSDQKLDNNSTGMLVLVNPSEVTPVEDLKGTTENNILTLTWKAPTNPTRKVVDNFEQYTPWLISNVGEWNMVDLNKNQTYGIQGFPFPHSGEPYAFIVFNPALAGIDYSGWMPQSGSQMLVSFCSGPDAGSQEFPNTNHWLISPQLPGIEQTVSFYAAHPTPEDGPETVEMLYSTKGKTPAEFIKAEDWQVVKVPTRGGDFANIEFSIPKGAKYFAIKHTTKNAFALMIDDIQYLAPSSAPEQYNIYCNRKLVATVLGNVCTFTQDGKELVEQQNVAVECAVTAVYENGIESAPTTCVVNLSGIASVVAPVQAFNIYTLDGVLVRRNVTTVQGLERGVYVTSDHRKIVIK